MSSVILVTPLIIANWSVISAAVLGACTAMGFSAVSGAMAGSRAKADSSVTRTEIEVENSEVLADAAGTDEQIVIEKEGVRATFSRDVRGALKVCMEGKGYSKGQLKQIGKELMEQVTQQYVYHRVVTELNQRGMPILHEEVEADRTVKIRVRSW